MPIIDRAARARPGVDETVNVKVSSERRMSSGQSRLCNGNDGGGCAS
jgi:hypothetical protein